MVDNRGEISVLDNAIRGTLECVGNEPPPTSAGNTAEEFDGQCEA